MINKPQAALIAGDIRINWFCPRCEQMQVCPVSAPNIHQNERICVRCPNCQDKSFFYMFTHMSVMYEPMEVTNDRE